MRLEEGSVRRLRGIQGQRSDGERHDQQSRSELRSASMSATGSMSRASVRRFGRCRLGRRTFPWLGPIVFAVAAAGLVAGQNGAQVQSPVPAHASPAAARNSVTFDSFVDAAIQQERRVINLLRYFKPVVETYIQEDQPDSEHRLSPKADDYFLSRLDLTGPVTVRKFSSVEEKGKKLAKIPLELTAEDLVLALFPDKDHFDRENYTFEFIRWETLGEVRCAVIDIKPRENAGSRGLVARLWVEDQDFNIVRFNGSYTSKQLAGRFTSTVGG